MGFRLSTGLRNAMLGTDGFKGAFDGGILVIYNGTIPTNADADEGGATKLLEITKDGNALASSGGLIFDTPDNGSIAKPSGDEWKGSGLADGTAYWFRLYDSNYTTGASTTAVRLDGTVGTASADLIMSNTSVVTGATTVLDSATFTLPAS